MLQKRYSETSTVALTTSAATTPEIDVSHFASGTIAVPTGSSITSLTYYTAPDMGGTYLAAYDDAGNAITQTVAAAKSYAMPAAIFGAAAIRIKANAAGNVTVALKT